ncbi:MAG TPA: lipid-A-disaccharide synthase, partial [Gammaproteobacteria bacterium]|nr:lipid-A-disaccharide synthase [Gammaproteobacteria bacterium]
MIRIGIVAGEPSGDLLAADLMRAVHERVPDAVFEGVAGPRMIEAGCRALYPLERLSVMGLVEPLKHLPGLLKMRRGLRRHFMAERPDLFIGVDAPDFNLSLEASLKAAGIPTVHYVSPSVWAWRRYRLHKIARAVDRMLTLFPFEADFYREHGVRVSFVGHPLADLIPADIDSRAARRDLGLAEQGPLIALLPGSRESEVARLAQPFVETAAWCLKRRPELRFVAAFASAATRQLFEQAQARWAPSLPITLIDGRSREAMCAADAVLLASGTATLEALLLKRPMVVAYRLAPLTYWLARRLVRTRYYSLPNLLAGRRLVPEITQHEVIADVLG